MGFVEDANRKRSPQDDPDQGKKRQKRDSRPSSATPPLAMSTVPAVNVRGMPLSAVVDTFVAHLIVMPAEQVNSLAGDINRMRPAASSSRERPRDPRLAPGDAHTADDGGDDELFTYHAATVATEAPPSYTEAIDGAEKPDVSYSSLIRRCSAVSDLLVIQEMMTDVPVPLNMAAPKLSMAHRPALDANTCLTYSRACFDRMLIDGERELRRFGARAAWLRLVGHHLARLLNPHAGAARTEKLWAVTALYSFVFDDFVGRYAVLLLTSISSL